jgi:acetyltransferase-like isoleucine patch superfamily enzyme
MSFLLKLAFRTNSLIIKLVNKYRTDYFRHIHQLRATIAPGVGFGKGSDVLFFPETANARLIIGERTTFRQRCNIGLNFDGILAIGKDNFFNNDCSVTCLHSVIIGNNNLFGEGVKIYDHNHEFRDKEKLIQEQGFKKGRIQIGNNCWFGSNCIILNNVTIGDNVIIGANVLVYKSIESNSIVRATMASQNIPY